MNRRILRCWPFRILVALPVALLFLVVGSIADLYDWAAGPEPVA